MTEREQKVFNYLSFVQSAESLFTLESDELDLMKRILLEILDFLNGESTAKAQNASTVVQIYQIILDADQRLKFSQLFESNALSIVCHYNIASSYQRLHEIKNSISHITDAIIEYELFLKTFCKSADSHSLILLKKRFICVYLQTAALYSHAKNHNKALKIITTAVNQLTVCLADFRHFATALKLSHYEPIVDELTQALDSALKPFSPDQTLRKKLNSAQANVLIHSPENNRKLFMSALESSRKSGFKLSSQWLEYFSIQNVMTASFISMSLFEPSAPQLQHMNDIIIELILYVSISYFALATEKRYLGISECQYSDHKMEDGYGKKFLTALQNEKALLSNNNYVERWADQRVLPHEGHRDPVGLSQRHVHPQLLRVAVQEQLLDRAQAHRGLSRRRRKKRRFPNR